MRSPRRRPAHEEKGFRRRSHSSHGSSLMPLTIRVARRCMRSIKAMSHCRYGDDACWPYSRIGLTRAICGSSKTFCNRHHRTQAKLRQNKHLKMRRLLKMRRYPDGGSHCRHTIYSINRSQIKNIIMPSLSKKKKSAFYLRIFRLPLSISANVDSRFDI